MSENVRKISEEKFSEIEYFDNGICLNMKTGKSKDGKFITNNVYLKREDLQKLFQHIVHSLTVDASSTKEDDKEYDDIPIDDRMTTTIIWNDDDDDDKIEDAIY